MCKDKMNPLLSVIVPVYNSEPYLKRCLDSVLECSYKNLEIIVVDDCSPGSVKDIVESYMKIDSRIKFVQHIENRGLYLARLTGVEHSNGSYIAFLDSDDHVSVDFYRRMIEKAVITNSDMVIGEICMEYDDHYSYFNLFHTRLLDIDVKDEEVRNLLFSQSGKDFSLHVVWNKIYSRELWDRAYPYLRIQRKHLIMCEDVLYSSVLFYFANHITNIHGDFVYYYQSSDSSTSLSNNYKKYEKNIRDIELVFDTLDDIFNRIGDESVKNNLEEWKELLICIWRRNIRESQLYPWKKQCLYNILSNITTSVDKKDIDDAFHYSITTNKKNLLSEELKARIVNPEIKVISFDIFDTLIYRPFWNPTDLFYLLDIYANECLESVDSIDFRSIRIEAEKRAREKKNLNMPSYEEITFDEIYAEVNEYLSVDNNIIEKIKEYEIELELKYCKTREYAKEIFDLAKYLGKKIIITSDMYLPEGVIRKILDNAGYRGYSELFLSCNERLTKHSGNLFRKIVKILSIKPEEILHIGDNIHSDVQMANKIGLHSWHFPKANDVFMNNIPSLYGGETYNVLFADSFMMRDGYQYTRYWGLRAMLAVVANKIFSNPYDDFNIHTDFNADPRIIGYYATGMHLFAVSQWLINQTVSHKYKNMNFMARDGFLPMEAWKILNSIYNLDTNINYLYLSRSVVIPMQIRNESDFYGLVHNINVLSKSPCEIFELFKLILKDGFYEKRLDFCNKHSYLFEKRFSSIKEFYEFIKIFKNESIDYKKLRKYKESMNKYLDEYFTGKTATFDIGYSCRVEAALKSNYDYDISPYYIHINNDISSYRSKRFKINIHKFYEYSPGVTGVLRELIISKMEPSCKNLVFREESMVPEFKSYKLGYTEKYVLEIIQKKALEFVEDMTKIFDEDLKKLAYQRSDASIPFEYLLASAKLLDRKIFSHIMFEDDLGEGKKFSLFDYWTNQIKRVNTTITRESNNIGIDSSQPKWKRAIYLYFMDRDYLKYKVKERYKYSPQKLGVLIHVYRGLRAIYRKFR